MSSPPDPPHRRDHLTSRFRSGDAMRTRTVSEVVLSTVIDVPTPPDRILADWERDIASHLFLEPGDVEPMPLARTRARWPDLLRCMRAMRVWTDALGLSGILDESELALMACRGARYHHDGAHYGGAAFCNLFLSADKGLDVHFPAMGRRIPLLPGTAMLFDTGQPHGVVRRDGAVFRASDFIEQDSTQVFLSWELSIEDEHVGHALGVAFDVEPPSFAPPQEECVLLDGAVVAVCPLSGQWRR